MKRRAFGLLLHWVQQREMARRHKEAGRQHPYCTDDIVNKYRFCNVIRMDDRVSQWINNNWYYRHGKPNTVWFACAVARYFNWPDTLRIIRYPDDWRPKVVLTRLNEIQGKTFSAAYIIPAPGGSRKIEHVINNVLTPLYNDPPSTKWPLTLLTMQEMHAELCTRPGFGSFLAGQVVADMRHAGVWKYPPKDRMTWAPLGPGSIRGINRLMGQPATQSVHPESHEVMREAFRKLVDRLDDPVVERMEMMDFQNVCCEYDKYCRVLNGEGKPKALYVPGRGA